MAFEKFERIGRSGLATVSIWSRGQIGFSLGAVKKYGLDKNDYVVLYYDKESERVGIKFLAEKNDESAIRLNKRSTGIMIGAKPFLDHYEIDYKETRKYTLELSKEEALYIINLAHKAE